MPLTIPDATTRAAVAAATDQEAQLAAALGVTDVTVQFRNGSDVRCTQTYGAPVILPTDPRTANLGALTAHTPGVDVQPTVVALRVGGVDTVTLTCGVGTGDVPFAAAWVAGARPNLSDPVAGKMTVTANSSLPLSALPSWVPAAGEIALLTSGANLANNYRSVVAPTHNADPSVEITNLYNGYAVNPHWGTYGAIVGFGGGHSQTNDNSVWCLELGASSCTFKRLTTPTDWGISAADNDTGTHTISANYGENFDGQPAAPHSYQTNVIIPPASGGAACGTFLTVVRKTVEYIGSGDYTAAHAVAFANTAGATGSYTLARYSSNYLAGNGQKPAWAAFVPAVGSHNPRVYYESRGGGDSRSKWFDVASLTYGDYQSGLNRLDGIDPDGGALFYVPTRAVLVFMDSDAAISGGVGAVRVQYMDVSAANPSWLLGSLDTSIAAKALWGCADWVPDRSRIIAGAVNADADCVYEIALPATLTDPWPCTRVAFTGGQTIAWSENGSPTNITSSGRWMYNSVVKSFIYWPLGAVLTGNDSVYVYRPQNT